MGFPEQRGRGIRKATVGDLVQFKSPNIPKCLGHLGIVTRAIVAQRISGANYTRYEVHCEVCQITRSGPAAMFTIWEQAWKEQEPLILEGIVDMVVQLNRTPVETFILGVPEWRDKYLEGNMSTFKVEAFIQREWDSRCLSDPLYRDRYRWVEGRIRELEGKEDTKYLEMIWRLSIAGEEVVDQISLPKSRRTTPCMRFKGR